MESVKTTWVRQQLGAYKFILEQRRKNYISAFEIETKAEQEKGKGKIQSVKRCFGWIINLIFYLWLFSICVIIFVPPVIISYFRGKIKEGEFGANSLNITLNNVEQFQDYQFQSSVEDEGDFNDDVPESLKKNVKNDL